MAVRWETSEGDADGFPDVWEFALRGFCTGLEEFSEEISSEGLTFLLECGILLLGVAPFISEVLLFVT